MGVEEDIYPDAAQVLWTDETLHERWQREFGDEGGQDGRFALCHGSTGSPSALMGVF